MIIYLIDTVILSIDTGYGLRIWQMTESMVILHIDIGYLVTLSGCRCRVPIANLPSRGGGIACRVIFSNICNAWRSQGGEKCECVGAPVSNISYLHRHSPRGVVVQVEIGSKPLKQYIVTGALSARLATRFNLHRPGVSRIRAHDRNSRVYSRHFYRAQAEWSGECYVSIINQETPCWDSYRSQSFQRGYHYPVILSLVSD
jgi:hypothetical protein